jgi:phosphoribosylamine---glycine ligase
MNILLIGGGGREHALAWALARSPRTERLYVAPGNGGTARLAKCENVAIAVDDLDGLVDFGRANAIDLTVVGPEAPLVAGVVDRFQAAGLRVFGPSAAAARLEGSKAFSKEFMLAHAIPTAQAAIFQDFDAAMRYLRGLDDAPVIKASGLAAGKGVILPDTKEGAAGVIQDILLRERFGAAGQTILLEERMAGPELSVLALCDGTHAAILPPAQDHKRLLDDDEGPNTGGMGAFAPSPLATPALMAAVEETIIRPTLAGMAAAGTPYVGVLYVGLMLTSDGPKVLEYNCRFGDPETQAILPLLQSDLVDLLLACVEGRLAQTQVEVADGAAVTVVLAAPGYPDEYESGVEITEVETAEALGCQVFHAGTKMKDRRLLTAGGRVLAVTAVGADLAAARAQAYAGAAAIRFNGVYYRRDIARRAAAA